MSCHPRVTEWTTIIQMRLPHLTKPQVTVLALWSLGMVLARSCALTAVSAFLATWLGRKEPAVRRQLREFCYEATAKRGVHRCAPGLTRRVAEVGSGNVFPGELCYCYHDTDLHLPVGGCEGGWSTFAGKPSAFVMPIIVQYPVSIVN